MMTTTLYSASCAVFLASLVSCGIGTYNNPEGSPELLARIKNHDVTQVWNPTIFANDEKVMVYSVDGERVSYDMSWTPGTKTILLTPGYHKLEILVSSNKKTVYRRNIVTVEINTKQGKTYLLKGTYKDTDARIWMEEEGNSKIVLPPRDVEILAVLPGNQVPVMIFVPAG